MRLGTIECPTSSPRLMFARGVGYYGTRPKCRISHLVIRSTGQIWDPVLNQPRSGLTNCDARVDTQLGI